MIRIVGRKPNLIPLLVLVGLINLIGVLPIHSVELEKQLRRPVAVETSADGKRLYVGNRRSGSVSVVDVEHLRISAEWTIAQTISDLVKVPNARALLATDEKNHELILLHVDGMDIEIGQRLAVNKYPVSVTVSKDGRHASVGSLWSRRLTLIQLPINDDEKMTVIGQLDLPFAPREQLFVEGDSRLIVADSFGGKLGVVNYEDQQLLHTVEVPGHNIRGLGVSSNGKMLLVSHQMLNELAHTVRNDVHWGLLMSNDLRWLSLQAVLDGAEDLYKDAHMHPIGEAGRGGGDPGGLDVAPNGTVVVTIAGTDELAFGKEDDFSLFRLDIGSFRPAKRVGRESQSESAPTDKQAANNADYDSKASRVDEYGVVQRAGSVHHRPTAVATSPDSQWAYVANTFRDSITIVSLTNHKVEAELSLGPQPQLTLADRGELLFFDSRLSHDGWMSCNSCHTEGHTNGMLNDNFSDKSFGAPKRVLSLLGRANTAPFAWNGEAKDFDEQIRTSITNTMQADDPPTDNQITAISAYLETLQSPPPLDFSRGNRNEKAIERGHKLFETNRCTSCHAPPTYTTPRVYNVGLKDRQGNERFNPPTLRGVGQRGPFFHEGQAETLEEVFRDFKHKLRDELTEEQLKDLVAFLRSL